MGKAGLCLAVVCLVGGCRAKTGEVKLFELAPAGTQIAVVAQPGAVSALRENVRWVLGLLPAEVAGQARALLAAASLDLLDEKALSAAGLDPGGAVAVFADKKAPLAIVLPVKDRGKLRAALKGTEEGGRDLISGWLCGEVKGRYACAPSKEAHGSLGKSTALAEIERGWKQRGSIEVYLAPGALPPDFPGMDATTSARLIVDTVPGRLTLRLHVAMKPIFAALGGGPLTKALLAAEPPGFLTVDATPFLKYAAQLPAAPLAGGVSLRDLAGALSGELVVHVLPGDTLAGLLRLGVRDEATVRRLVEACGELPVGPVGTATRTGKGCRLDVQAMGKMPAWQADVELAPGALVVSYGKVSTTPGRAGTLTAVGEELLAGRWLFAAWGRGLLAGALESAPIPDDLGVVGVVTRFTEFGIGVGWSEDGYHAVLHLRTTLDNPRELLTAAEPLFVRLAKADRAAGDELRALAAQHPKSPLSQDLELGGMGAAMPVLVTGVLAAVAIPAFMKNARRAKSTEATAGVKRIHTAASAHWAEHKRFPGPTAEAPAKGACCRQAGKKCQPDPALWSAEPWKSLAFSMDDPHYYSYEYTVAGDGQSFSAAAYGDLDCDGVYSTFEMVGKVGEDGSVTGQSGLYRDKDLE